MECHSERHLATERRLTLRSRLLPPVAGRCAINAARRPLPLTLDRICVFRQTRTLLNLRSWAISSGTCAKTGLTQTGLLLKEQPATLADNGDSVTHAFLHGKWRRWQSTLKLWRTETLPCAPWTSSSPISSFPWLAQAHSESPSSLRQSRPGLRPPVQTTNRSPLNSVSHNNSFVKRPPRSVASSQCFLLETLQVGGMQSNLAFNTDRLQATLAGSLRPSASGGRLAPRYAPYELGPHR